MQKGWEWGWSCSWIGHKEVGEIDNPGNYYVVLEAAGLFSKTFNFLVKEKITRGSYSFDVSSVSEKSLVQDLLGIKPAGDDIDTHLSKLYIGELNSWLVYWDQAFSKAGRTDLSKFVTDKYNVYKTTAKLPPPPPYVYKVLPSPPSELKAAGVKLYEQLDDALNRKNVADVLKVLREMLVTHNSPIIIFGIVIGIKAVLAAIVTVLGSKAFTSFMVEETLQQVDFAIYQASQNKDWEGEAALLAKKKEILEMTPWEQFVSWLPSINLIDAVKKYVEVAKLKLGIDEKLWNQKSGATATNPNVNLDKAAAAIEKGEDPTQYLPSTESVSIPEVISGEVISVVDGDTIDLKRLSGEVYRVRLVGIDAPEFSTTAGKASAKYLTDLIHGKTVTVEVDPKNQRDVYNRVLGRILYNDVDINKKMLSDGYAQYYFIGENKYVNVEEYKAAAKVKGKITVSSKPTFCAIYVDQIDTGKLTTETIELKEGTYVFGAVKEGYTSQSQVVVVEPNKTKEIRFELKEVEVTPPEVPPVTPPGEVVTVPPVTPPEKFTIEVNSTPSNAKLFIDDTYTGHRTPSNEKELKDVIGLFSVGTHTLKATKAGQEATQEVTLLSGANPKIHLILKVVGLPPLAPPVVVTPTPPPTVEVPDVVKAIFEDLIELTVGRAMITRKEINDLKIVYGV
jgi:endonuclease YncB( thermonuclease family)